MHLLQEIKIPGQNLPRGKATYKGLLGGKLITFILADDFQEDLKRELNIAIATSGQQQRFPLGGSCSLIIDVQSSRKLVLIGVLKNILDAGNKLLYTDDCHVDSVVISRRSPVSYRDVVRVRVISNTELYHHEPDMEMLQPYLVLDVCLRTFVEDRYLPYPTRKELVEVVNPNVATDVAIREKIACQYKLPISDNQLAISICTNALSDRADIDNLALNFTANMEGIIFSKAQQITRLHLQRKRDADESVIRVYTQ